MIKISVVSYYNEVPSEPQYAVFGPAGATIGRSNDNFMVLQDSKRYVSRLQASVKSDGARHFIANLSEANPILVNGEQIALGQDVELQYGDEIQIGLYLLKAESPATAATAPAPTPAPDQAPAGFDLSDMSASAADPFADLLGSAVPTGGSAPVKPAPVASRAMPTNQADPLGLNDLLGTPSALASNNVPLAESTQTAPAVAESTGRVDPLGFDDLLGASSAAPATRASATNSVAPSVHDHAFDFDDLLSGPSHAALPLERKAPIIPEDFDPFATPSEAQRNSSDPLAELSNDSVSLESLAAQNVTIDGLMSSAGSGASSLPDPLGLGPARSSETDPLALFASESILPSKQDNSFLGDIMSDHVSELNSHFAMPQAAPQTSASAVPEVAAPVPTAPPAAIPPPAPTPSAPIAAPPQTPPLAPSPQQRATAQAPLDPHALAEAFLRGANLPMDTLPAGVTLEWMEMMGRFAATATDGAVELIASRALVKREVKADLTMIVVRNNNPLKFLPDGNSALIQMLGKKIPGFMNPVEAMQDAYADLRAHQVGVVAGMRAALQEVLRRCDPALLEKKLKNPTLLDSLVAANRKAKMWDLYAELFKDIYLESQDDFQTLFGKAFLTAYESEIERFHQRNKP